MIRIKITKWICLIIFIFLGLNIANLQIYRGAKFRDLSSKNCIRLLPQEGGRGRIFDRSGNIIAGNQLQYDLLVLPQKEVNVDKVLMRLSGILYLDFKELKKRFKNNYIAPSLPVVILKNIEPRKAIMLEELKSDIGSIIIHGRPQRSYPYGELASHVLGYLSQIDRWRLTKLADYGYQTKDLVGFGGVEEKYDYYLRPQVGGLSFEVDYRSRFVRVLGFRPPHNGKDIQLTIDLNIQRIIEEALIERSGSVIIMEPYTGEIIAMASRPSFNPADFIRRSGNSINELFNDPKAPLINRAISASYPPGSIFKLVVAVAGLELHKINQAAVFLCTGSILIGNREFSCWDTHGQENIFQAIAGSCNVFFYRTGLLLGAQVLHDYALRFGFSRLSGIDLPYETGGFVPGPLSTKIYKMKNWFDGDTANFSIGQGDLLVTPLQVTRMMAVFANKGYLVRPYIVKAIQGRDISRYQKKIIKLHLKPAVIDCVRQGSAGVITDPSGTANVLSDLSISVAGKTGTAQAPPGLSHGWFAGFFPYNSPKFVICVFLERGGSGHAASIAARQIIQRMIEDKLIE